jgi:hypothetical protein
VTPLTSELCTGYLYSLLLTISFGLTFLENAYVLFYVRADTDWINLNQSKGILRIEINSIRFLLIFSLKNYMKLIFIIRHYPN